MNQSPDSSEGGYSPPGHSGDSEEEKDAADGKHPARDGVIPPEALSGEGVPAEPSSSLPLQPGLTQVILDLAAHRAERVSGSAVASYESGAKDQKKNARLPKGSMLDKKIG